MTRIGTACSAHAFGCRVTMLSLIDAPRCVGDIIFVAAHAVHLATPIVGSCLQDQGADEALVHRC